MSSHHLHRARGSVRRAEGPREQHGAALQRLVRREQRGAPRGHRLTGRGLDRKILDRDRLTVEPHREGDRHPVASHARCWTDPEHPRRKMIEPVVRGQDPGVRRWTLGGQSLWFFLRQRGRRGGFVTRAPQEHGSEPGCDQEPVAREPRTWQGRHHLLLAADATLGQRRAAYPPTVAVRWFEIRPPKYAHDALAQGGARTHGQPAAPGTRGSLSRRAGLDAFLEVDDADGMATRAAVGPAPRRPAFWGQDRVPMLDAAGVTRSRSARSKGLPCSSLRSSQISSSRFEGSAANR